LILLLLFSSITLNLDEAINRALSESLLYLQAKKNFLIQQKTNSFIYSKLFPNVYGRYDYSRSHGTSSGLELFDTTKSYNVTLSWDLKLTDFVDAYSTRHKNSSVYFSFLDTRNEIVFQVVTAYLNSLMMEQLLLSKGKAVERSRNNLLLVEEKMNLGSASKAELLKSKVDHLQAQYELLRTKKGERVAKLALAKLIGMEPTDTLNLTEPSIKFGLPSKDSILNDALRNDPPLNMYKASARSAKLDLLSNTANQLFSLSLNGSYGYSGDNFPSSSLWDEGDFYSIRLSISVPLFTSFSRVNQIMISRLQLSVAEMQARDREREIRISVEDGYLGYKESVEKLTLTKTTLELAKESYKATEERYRLGEASIIELLSAEEDLLQAQYSTTQALFDYYLSIYKVKRTMGRLP